MQITLLMIGKSNSGYISEGIETFIQRIKHYHPVKLLIIPDLKERKNLSSAQIKEKESALLLQNIPTGSIKILLDEKGKEYRSTEFAMLLQKLFNGSAKEITFIIGGAYGVSEIIKEKSDQIISLSQMTFTHQFIRMMLCEQIYRAFTILNNEPYHNE